MELSIIKLDANRYLQSASHQLFDFPWNTDNSAEEAELAYQRMRDHVENRRTDLTVTPWPNQTVIYTHEDTSLLYIHEANRDPLAADKPPADPKDY